jgi:hypothetical protein
MFALSFHFLLLSHMSLSHLLFFDIALSFSLSLSIDAMRRLVIHGLGYGFIVD